MATGTNGIATWSNVSGITGYSVDQTLIYSKQCPTYSDLSSHVLSGYTFKVNGSYASNQCVKTSDIIDLEKAPTLTVKWTQTTTINYFRPQNSFGCIIYDTVNNILAGTDTVKESYFSGSYAVTLADSAITQNQTSYLQYVANWGNSSVFTQTSSNRYIIWGYYGVDSSGSKDTTNPRAILCELTTSMLSSLRYGNSIEVQGYDIKVTNDVSN